MASHCKRIVNFNVLINILLLPLPLPLSLIIIIIILNDTFGGFKSENLDTMSL